MEPVEQRLSTQRQAPAQSRWERVRRHVVFWTLILGPTLLYLAVSLLPISPTSIAGESLRLVQPIYLLAVSVVILRSVTRANPHALRDTLRSRTMRRVLGALAFMLVGIVSLGIGAVFFGLSGGFAEIVSSVVVFGSLGLFFLALFLGLLSASKHDIDRYLAQRRQSAPDI